jgi:hypothetical protein
LIEISTSTAENISRQALARRILLAAAVFALILDFAKVPASASGPHREKMRGLGELVLKGTVTHLKAGPRRFFAASVRKPSLKWMSTFDQIGEQ